MASSRYQRTRGAAEPRKALAIFSEGTVTEVEYIRYLLSKLRIPKELVQIQDSEHTDPKGLIDDAVAAKKRNLRDWRRNGTPLIENWWVIADTELNPDRSYDAIQKAKDNGIWLCLNDPSIEFWLLLHFLYTTKGFNSVEQLIRELQKYLTGYSSSNKRPGMDVLFPLIGEAIGNADKLRRCYTSQGFTSPRTDFDLLVQAINCQAGRDRELFERRQPSMESLSMYI